MAPTPGTRYQLNFGTGTSLAIGAVVAGEVLVAKVTTNASTAAATCSGGGLTWTSRANVGTASHANSAIFTAVVPTSQPSGFTLTLGGGSTRAAVVERWSNAALDATPVVVTTSTGLTASLTTEAANSAISWCGTDWNENSVTGATMAGGGTLEYSFVDTNSYAGYHGYIADTGAIGAKTFGATPTTTTAANDNLAGIEILASGATFAKTGNAAARGAAGGTKSVGKVFAKTGTAAPRGTAGGAKQLSRISTKTGTAAARGGPGGTRQVFTFTKRGTAAARGGPGGTGFAQPSYLLQPVETFPVGQPVDLQKLSTLPAPGKVGAAPQPLSVSHVYDLGAPAVVGAAPQKVGSGSFALSPATVWLQGQGVTLGFVERVGRSHAGLPPVIVRGGVRIMAQNVLTGEWYNRELPLDDVELTLRLSGAQAITGTVNPENARVAREVLRLVPWGVWLHLEEGGEVRGSGILQPTQLDEDGSLALTALGPSAYAGRIPYTGEYSGVQVDPVDVVRTLWAHIQGFPRGDLGVTVTGASSVLIGQPLADPQTTTTTDGTGATVTEVTTTDQGPYMIHGYELPLIGRIIDQLGTDTPFDFVEECGYTDPAAKDKVWHRLRCQSPRIGTMLDLNLTQGENLLEHGGFEEPADGYADSAYVKGAGEGTDSIIGYAGTQIDNRLRLPAVVTDKTLKEKPSADSRAAEEVAARLASLEEIPQIVVNTRHPNSLWGTFGVGDLVLPRVRLPYYGAFAQWHRITEITWRPDDGIATLTLTRRDAFRDR